MKIFIFEVKLTILFIFRVCSLFPNKILHRGNRLGSILTLRIRLWHKTKFVGMRKRERKWKGRESFSSRRTNLFNRYFHREKGWRNFLPPPLKPCLLFPIYVLCHFTIFLLYKLKLLRNKLKRLFWLPQSSDSGCNLFSYWFNAVY